MKILFVSTEIWSLKNPERIVARKIVSGLIQNDNTVDVLSNKEAPLEDVNNEVILKNNSEEIFSKLKKKITGIEKKDFVKNVISQFKSIALYKQLLNRIL